MDEGRRGPNGPTPRNTGVAVPWRSAQPPPGHQRTSRGGARGAAHFRGPARPGRIDAGTRPHTRGLRRGCRGTHRAAARKSVVEGKGVYVGGRRTLNKKRIIV